MKPALGLIETMYWNGHNIDLWPYHLLRLRKGMETYDIDLDEDELREQCFYTIKQSIAPLNPKKVRLEIAAVPGKASVKIDVSDFTRVPGLTVSLGFAAGLCIDSSSANGLKTTERDLYNKALEQAVAAHYDDMIIHNEKGHLVETAIYNLAWKEHGKPGVFTPALSDGCIAGVLRSFLLAKGCVTEAVLTKEVLAKAESVWVVNALRGILPVRSIAGRLFEIRDMAMPG